MRFRAVRPSQLGKVDAIIVPLFTGAEPPAWLSRPARAAIARLVKEETGVTRLYGVNTLHEEPRVAIVCAQSRHRGRGRFDWRRAGCGGRGGRRDLRDVASRGASDARGGTPPP